MTASLTATALTLHFSAEQLHDFNANGFLIARGVASNEHVDRMRKVIWEQVRMRPEPAEYEADVHYPGAPASRDAPGGATIRRLLQAYDRDAAFSAWASSPHIVSPMHQLLGSQIRLSQVHHNCIMTKQPHYSSVTGWHQDIRYWSFQRPELVSMWLALGAEVPDNGCLSFLPGSHAQALSRGRFDDSLFLREDVPENRALIATRVTPTLDPGDLVLFHCRTLHAAGTNRTSEVKLSLVFTYYSADNHPIPDTRSASQPSIPL